MTKKQRTLLESNEIYVGTGSDNNGQCAAIMACLAQLDAAEKVVDEARKQDDQNWRGLRVAIAIYDKTKEQP